MKACSTCGAQLTDRMVEAINNPHKEESCPKAKRKGKNVSTMLENREDKLEKELLTVLSSWDDLSK